MQSLSFGPLRISEYECVQAVAIISSISVLITTLEAFALAKHYRGNELFSWRLHRLRGPHTANHALGELLRRLFEPPGVFIMLGLRAMSCIWVIAGSRSRYQLLLGCLGITITSLLLAYRGLDGKNGADQMTKITFLSLTLALISSSIVTWRIELAFLSLQLILAYCTAGILKLREKTWRDGAALLMILRQITYGNARVWCFAKRHPLVTRLVSMGTIAFECCFPCALLIPWKFSLIVLSVGLGFHLFNAIVVGLNTFFWAFMGVYPAVIWCAAWIQNQLYRAM
jgi:hypothetical protein